MVDAIWMVLHGWRNLDEDLFGFFVWSELSFRLVHSGSSMFSCISLLIDFVDNSGIIYIYILFQDLFVDFGIQFPSDHSDDPVLIKCAFHGGSDMVPWTHVVGTQDGRMLIDLTSEFTLLYQ